MAYTSANPGQAIGAARPSIDRALRKLFPSTSKLTFNPLFRAAVNAFDVVPRLVFPEFRALPPNHLRIRIGVGCGRWAHWLRDYNFRGRRFAGSYVGIDIDEEAIAWCRANYDAERFRFYRSSDASVSYNQACNHTAAAPSAYRVPLADAAFDLVFSNSLLSHLLEAELENYLRESYRLLKAGGAMMHSHFNIDYPPATYGTRHTFEHRLGNALIESEAQPEAAVAYHTDFLFDLCRRIGFSASEIVHMPGGAQHQPILLCRK
jgi:SAM-dependent methyltransferase